MSEKGCMKEASEEPGCSWLAVGRKREGGGENQRFKRKVLIFSLGCNGRWGRWDLGGDV